MRYFLSENRRNDLTNKLRSTTPQSEIDKYTKVPDDMLEVDLSMTAHVMAISHFHRLADKATSEQHRTNLLQNAYKGVTILKAYMEESMSRGLGENDFPISLAAIKKDLEGRTNLQ